MAPVSQSQAPRSGERQRDVITLQDLIGITVFNSQTGKELGRIKDIACNRSDHLVRSLILTRPGPKGQLLPCSASHIQGWRHGALFSSLLQEGEDTSQRLYGRIIAELRRSEELWWPLHVLDRDMQFPEGRTARIRDLAFSRQPLQAVHILCEERGVTSWTKLDRSLDAWASSPMRRSA